MRKILKQIYVFLCIFVSKKCQHIDSVLLTKCSLNTIFDSQSDFWPCLLTANFKNEFANLYNNHAFAVVAL